MRVSFCSLRAGSLFSSMMVWPSVYAKPNDQGTKWGRTGAECHRWPPFQINVLHQFLDNSVVP
jgi:hypothetical protein